MRSPLLSSLIIVSSTGSRPSISITSSRATCLTSRRMLAAPLLLMSLITPMSFISQRLSTSSNFTVPVHFPIQPQRSIELSVGRNKDTKSFSGPFASLDLKAEVSSNFVAWRAESHHSGDFGWGAKSGIMSTL